MAQTPRIKPKTSVLKTHNTVATQQILTMFCCAHRLAPCSAVLRDAPSCSGWEQKQRHTARHYVENERPRNTQSLNRMSPSDPSPRGSENPAEETEHMKARGDRGHEGPLIPHDQKKVRRQFPGLSAAPPRAVLETGLSGHQAW